MRAYSVVIFFILVSDAGGTIIDFGHSKLCDDKKAKDKGLAQLRYLLH